MATPVRSDTFVYLPSSQGAPMRSTLIAVVWRVLTPQSSLHRLIQHGRAFACGAAPGFTPLKGGAAGFHAASGEGHVTFWVYVFQMVRLPISDSPHVHSDVLW